ncbi:hypothetical protein J31TS4_19430 [Paenibacillus sp. J31TS4]|uniref:CPBP family intramembrane glutamic endopeptidase n=1 Tax=Paenibacillus sp. J31TS4 TaxID=2807195 RepID=UPI001B29B1C4|nr:CPBP family intramembrane glutamic endopeptidase [Paenibacillus sp. J31TS4]GIP38663.1 hypothetical protein J31TS4_19430 [Paenibacillus sp. J31TS4]
MKTNVKLVGLFALLGGAAQLLILPYLTALVASLGEGLSPVAAGLAMTAQTVVLVALCAAAGLWAAGKTGLEVPLLRQWLEGRSRGHAEGNPARGLLLAAAAGAAAGALTLAADGLGFARYLPVPVQGTLQTAWWQGLLAIPYGGIVEEVMARLFLMSLFVLVLGRLIGNQTSMVYWMAILLAGLLFGAGHLGTVYQMFGSLDAFLVVRTLVLNLIGGLVFGYLYWRRGLEAAIVAHMAADFVLHVLGAFLQG